MRRNKYFDVSRAFEFIWRNADREGIWIGDAVSLEAEFHVSEDAADSVLNELCDRHIIEKVYPGTYIIVKWRERDAPDA
jgi:hypothetical protein